MSPVSMAAMAGAPGGGAAIAARAGASGERLKNAGAIVRRGRGMQLIWRGRRHRRRYGRLVVVAASAMIVLALATVGTAGAAAPSRPAWPAGEDQGGRVLRAPQF